MVANLLVRGMLVGLVAGIIAFAFARTFGEPQVDWAIAFEESRSAAEAAAAGKPVEAEPELVSRDTQANLGLFTGVGDAHDEVLERRGRTGQDGSALLHGGEPPTTAWFRLIEARWSPPPGPGPKRSRRPSRGRRLGDTWAADPSVCRRTRWREPGASQHSARRGPKERRERQNLGQLGRCERQRCW